jgi:metallophosphoesterase (TIGR00282 family)
MCDNNVVFHGSDKKLGFRVLFLGDVVGRPGVEMATRWVSVLKERFQVDTVIINGENSASRGTGITENSFNALRSAGADAVTTGNHIWDRKESHNFISRETRLVRPCNYPQGAPGNGLVMYEVGATGIAVLNVMGRVFFRETLECPFSSLDKYIALAKSKSHIIIVDIHAEATSEKKALANYLDGRVSAVIGTHTHVLTNDATIFPKGTAFLTDAGFAGSEFSCLGFEAKPIVQRFTTQMPVRFNVDEAPPYVMNGVIMDFDRLDGRAKSINTLIVKDTRQLSAA